MSEQWIKPAGAKYGGSLLPANQPATKDATATATAAPTVVPRLGGIVSPDEPMFWLAGLLALGAGLMAYSTYVPVVKA